MVNVVIVVIGPRSSVLPGFSNTTKGRTFYHNTTKEPQAAEIRKAPEEEGRLNATETREVLSLDTDPREGMKRVRGHKERRIEGVKPTGSKARAKASATLDEQEAEHLALTDSRAKIKAIDYYEVETWPDDAC